MKKYALLLAVAILLSPLSASERGLITVADMIKSASQKDSVVVKGVLKKQITFDQITLNDGTGDVLIDFSNLKQNLKPGESVVVNGIYRGRLSRESAKAEILARGFTTDATAGQSIIAAHPAPSPETTPTSPSSVESRLEQLERLRTKGLITPEEYQEQRKRILADL